MRNRTFPVVIALSLSIGHTLSQSRRTPTKPATNEINRSAVFNPPQVVWGRMQEECQGPNSVECVASIMKQAGASSQAISFARMLKGDGYMDSFREMGRVDLATAFFPFRANTNGGTYLVNGSPSLIAVEDLDSWGKIDIRNDPLYAGIARKFPEVMLWGGEPGYESMQRLPTGGQRFIFSYVLLNGCHACDVAGYAHVSFNFDTTGRFIGTKLLRLSGPPRKKNQHPVRTSRRTPSSTASTKTVNLPLVANLEGGLLNLSSDGQFVVTQIERGGNSYTTKLWRPSQSQPLLSLEGSFKGFSPDSRFLMVSHYASDYTQIFDLYQIPSGHRVNSWRGWQFAGFSPDGKSIIAQVGYRDGKPITEFWDIEQGRRTRSLTKILPVFSHDARLMIFSDDNDPQTSIVATETNRPIRQLPGKFLWFSADDRTIATKDKGALKVWNTSSGELLAEIECWGEAFLSPSGEIVATEVFDYRRSKDTPITKISEVRTGKLLATVDGKSTSPYYPFLNDGTQLVTDITNNNKSVTKVWRASSGQLITQLEGGFRGFSSDGRFVMTEIWWTGREHTTKLWTAKDGALYANVEGYPMGFSRDSQFVFTGSNGVRVWRLKA